MKVNENEPDTTVTPRRLRPDAAPRKSLGGKAKRKRGLGGPIALICLAMVAVVGGVAYKTLRGIGGHGPNAVGPAEMLALLDPKTDKAQFPGRNRVNVLLIGKDYNYDRKDQPFTTDHGKSLGVRADSIMILSLDFDSGHVSALSVPRDTHVTAPDGHTGKINATYARGGAPLLRKTLTELLGVSPDYFIAVKPDAVKSIVDKLGGVEVESIDAMNYDDTWGHLHVHLPAGKQIVDGTQAVGFARFREVKSGTPHSREEGDPRRMARQQQLIRAMAGKGKSLSNLFQLDELANTALSQLETDMTRQQIFALVLLFRNMQPDQIQSAALEGKGTPPGGTYFFMPDQKKKVAMVDWLLKGDESAADRLTFVAVENGTDIPGAASRVAEKLRADGFDAQSAGKAPAVAPDSGASTVTTNPGTPAGPSPNVTATRIVYAKASMATRAQKIAQLLGVGATQVTKAVRADTSGAFTRGTLDRADVTVILGGDLAASFGPRSAQL